MSAHVLLDFEAAKAWFLSRIDESRLPIPSKLDNLEDLAALLRLNCEYTPFVLAAYEPVFLQVLASCVEAADASVFANILQCFSLISPYYRAADPLLGRLLEAHKELLGESLQSNAEQELVLDAVYRLLCYHKNEVLNYVFRQHVLKLISSENVQVRGLAILILCISMNVSESLTKKWIENNLGDNIPSTINLLPVYNAQKCLHAKNLFDSRPSYAKTFELDRVSPLLASFGTNLVSKYVVSPSIKTQSFIETKTSQQNLVETVCGLNENRPILVCGPSGSGKTATVEFLHSQLCPTEELVRLHLGDQTDSKSLLGTYSTGEKPGTFEWRDGVLTSAALTGQWVFVRDLDKAPKDVTSILLSLLERRELVLASRNQVIKAAPNFRLFATITTQSSDSHIELIGKRLWHEVRFTKLDDEDLEEIISAQFPSLGVLAPKFVKTFNEVETVCAKRRSFDRVPTTRDLLKWAARSESILQMQKAKNVITEEGLENIFLEALSALTSFFADPRLRESFAELIADQLDIGTSKIPFLTDRRVPQITLKDHSVIIGRATVVRQSTFRPSSLSNSSLDFSLTKHSCRLLENLAAAVLQAEPLLLVGETGTGKTTVVQHLANMVNQKLTVINISQQMETDDLLGNHKPLDAKLLGSALSEEFYELFDSMFPRSKNHEFLMVLEKSMKKFQWTNVVKLWKAAHKLVSETYNKQSDEEQRHKRRRLDVSYLASWQDFLKKVDAFSVKLHELKKGILFQFVDGLLVKAMRRGQWILLDELNLAPADTLESLTDLLNNPPTVTLVGKGAGEDSFVQAHSNFRLFACMNPATDVYKKDLPFAVRSRFTEIYVDSLDRDREDLRMVIENYIGRAAAGDQHAVNDVLNLYLEAKQMSESHKIVDGAQQNPHFSIRTLSRALVHARTIAPLYGLRRALFEGFAMNFTTNLDEASEELLQKSMEAQLLSKMGNMKSVMSTMPPAPDQNHIAFRHYWLQHGPEELQDDEKYIITPFVERNLLKVARAIAAHNLPILIQGPTSSGKTSMVHHLAKRTGHHVVRINNHEHTDLQEYIGSYVSDTNGSLIFQEGVLVEALRKGHWLILDELNLAPTDVLEALNRLLDDNRELLINETQEIVKPHPDFMLFATQNPPGAYAGRKLLSRAFRNRFIEIHFNNIPETELETILRDRCSIAPSYAKKIVEVYQELSRRRQGSRVFEQKEGFATLRDLFRWANRPAVGYEELALNGFYLLAERVRTSAEKQQVMEVIEHTLKVKIDIDYSKIELPQEALAAPVVWTSGMKRLFHLVTMAIKQNEPILLVGETGCGKTTIFQVLSLLFQRPLSIVNAYQNLETGDLIGSQRPIRNRSEKEANLLKLLQTHYNDNESSLESLKYRYAHGECVVPEIKAAIDSCSTLFEWVDGSLVQSMKDGHLFLLDEISLADDSVLERLNSVLEFERKLLLPEKGSSDIDVQASDGFQFFATMNPGGDYGKKELSLALRNRFTEIWVPSLDNLEDVRLIVESKLVEEVKSSAEVIVQFSQWFSSHFGGNDYNAGIVSLRNILNWVTFVNSFGPSGSLSLNDTLFHGACMVYIDAIGTGSFAHLVQDSRALQNCRMDCITKFSAIINENVDVYVAKYTQQVHAQVTDGRLSLCEFTLPQKQGVTIKQDIFSLAAPTTAKNALRVVRAMQISKPILLEGSPGVGKTSLVSALAAATGNSLTRINLSDQTDLADLFGSDSPIEGEDAGRFAWRDAPFLRAMKEGHWVLLDEMNLASQSVLEGLNSCLDHRAQVFIPELDMLFECHKDFRVFAAQNPQSQGGGRKGLPKSFVNRFSVVYVDSLDSDDLKVITQHLYPSIPSDQSDTILKFVAEIEYRVNVARSIGVIGAPFEFNLRDSLRWFELLSKRCGQASDYLDVIVRSRFRTANDRKLVTQIFANLVPKYEERIHSHAITESEAIFGTTEITRPLLTKNSLPPLQLSSLQCNVMPLEVATTAVSQGWPVIIYGPSSAGKTSLVRLMAYIYGMRLHEIPINTDIDSSDILGEFDQIEPGQDLAQIWNSIDNFMASSLSEQIDPRLALLSDAAQTKDLDTAEAILKQFSSIEASSVCSSIQQLREHDYSKPKFQWFDGGLVKAIIAGDWVVLDNANLCNPSVLDRLNSLTEMNGSILINECPDKDGHPRILKPHPNFRIFMTADPKNGELSRAMRNRGVEIFLDNLEQRATEFDKITLGMSVSASTPQADLPNIEELSIHDKKSALYTWLPTTALGLRQLTLQLEPQLSAPFSDQLLSVLPVRSQWSKFAFTLSSQLNLLLQLQPGNTLYNETVAYFQRMKQSSELAPLFNEDLGLPSVYVLSAHAIREREVEIRKAELRQVLCNLLRDATEALNEARIDETVLVKSLRESRRGQYTEIDLSKFLEQLQSVSLLGPQFFEAYYLIQGIISLCLKQNFDPSWLAVYRDLLHQFCKKNNTPDLLEALESLGQYTSLSDSGCYIDVIWATNGQDCGFATQQHWENYCDIAALAKSFDLISAGVSNKDLVVAVRSQLCRALADSHQRSEMAEVIALLKDSLSKFEAGAPIIQHFTPTFDTLAKVAYLSVHSHNDDSSNSQSLLALSPYCEKLNSTLSNYQLWTLRDLSPVALGSWNEHDMISAMLSATGQLQKVPLLLRANAIEQGRKLLKSVLDHVPAILADKSVQTAVAMERIQGFLLKAVPDYEHSGSADLITVSQQLLNFYVPPTVYDPAARQQVEHSIKLIEKADSEDTQSQWLHYKSVFDNVSSFPTDTVLYERLKNIGEFAPLDVYRPSETQISLVFHHLNSLKLMLAPAVYSGISDNARFVVWERNIRAVMQQLEQFTVYGDLLEPVFAAASGILLGVSEKILPEQHLLISATRQLLQPLTLASPEKFSGAAARFLESQQSELQSHENPYLVVLRLAALHDFDQLATLIENLLQHFLQMWSLNKLKKEEEDLEEARGFTMANIDDEELATEDFMRLFPDFDGDLTELENVKASTLEDLLPEVVKAYMVIHSSNKLSINEAIKLLAGWCTSLMDTPLLSPAVHQQLYSVLYVFSQKLSPTIVEPANLNFYCDPYVSETQKAVELAQAIKLRIDDLLLEWPEHETLRSIQEACLVVLGMTPSEPVAKYLAKVEQLHHLLNEWQRFASKQVSVLSLMTSVSDLIICWRKIELTTWNSLFVQERDAAVNADSKYWFHLYETLISNPLNRGEEAVDRLEITQVLITFMSASTFFVFDHRINLLNIFAKHARSYARDPARKYMQGISDLILNVIGFFTQYTTGINSSIERREKDLSKQIKEVILLTSWRDANVLALKQSAKRSHASLFKVIRKYRSFMSQKCGPLFDSAPGSPPTMGLTSTFATFVFDVPTEAIGSQEFTGDLVKLNGTRRFSKMTDFSNQVKNLDLPTLLPLAKTVCGDAANLESSTPKTFSEETKKEISSLKVQKLQLLTSTLQALAEAGLRKGFVFETKLEQGLLSNVLAKSQHMKHPSDQYFYRIVEMMPRLRSAISESQADVPIPDLRRGLAFGEHLVSVILKLRKVRARNAGDLDAVRSKFLSLQSSSYDPESLSAVRSSPSIAAALSNIAAVARQIPEIIDSVLELTNTNSDAGQQTLLSVRSASDLCVMASDPELPNLNTLEDARRKITELCASLTDDSTTMVRSFISDWHEDLSVNSPEAVDVPSPVAIVEKATKLAEKTLHAVQETVREIKQGSNLDEEESKWLIKITKTTMSSFKQLRLTQICELYIQLCSTLEVCSAQPELSSALATLMRPFFEGYSLVSQAMLSALDTQLSETTQAGYMLLKLLIGLASNGLCSPQEQGEEEDAGNQLQNGTGLGDGSGAQTNNEDVEEDEDLLEHAQTKNDEQEDQDDADSDSEKPVDMQGDMEGELEDAEGSSDEDQSEQDMDDEVASLDENDEDAIDEKLWDDKDEGAQDAKEKDTDKKLDGQQDDDNLAGADDADADDDADPNANEDMDDADNNAEDAEEADGEDEDLDDEDGEAEDGAADDENKLDEHVDNTETLDLPDDIDMGESDGSDDDNDNELNDQLDNAEDQLEDQAVQEQEQEQDDAEADATEEANADDAEDEADADDAELDAQGDSQDDVEDEDNDQAMEQSDSETEEPMDEKEKSLNDQNEPQEAANIENQGLEANDVPQDGEEEQDEPLAASTTSGSGQNAENQSSSFENQENATGQAADIDADHQPDSEQQKPEEDPNSTDSQLRQLGDAMKEFFERQRQIENKSETEQPQGNVNAEQDVDPSKMDVEHVAEDEDFDAQVLGANNELVDQEMDIDMKHAQKDEVEEEEDEAIKAEAAAADAAAEAGAGVEQEDQAAESGNDDVGVVHTDMVDSDDDMDGPFQRTAVSKSSGELDISTGRKLWREYSSRTHDHALILTEQLRLILEPTVATKMAGDYKSGKRLNMRRIIPFIASQFKKDKIWLRRTKPSKRQYQIMLAVDDSRSMGNPAIADLAREVITLVSQSLTHLEAGELAIMLFGETSKVVHSFEQPFNNEAGARALAKFSFEQERTNVEHLLQSSLSLFETAKHSASGSEKWQLQIIISDGVIDSHDSVQRLVRQALDQQIMIVFVVLDAANQNGSILDLKQVNYVTNPLNGGSALQVERYMDKFPFQYYVIVKQLGELPLVLSSVLRQFFQSVEG